MSKHRSIAISSRNYWAKLLPNHQSNWAVIDSLPDEFGFRVWFFNLDGWICDYLDFSSIEDGESALLKNDYKRYTEIEFGFLGYPDGRFEWWMPEKPDDRPYSTGKYWVT